MQKATMTFSKILMVCGATCFVSPALAYSPDNHKESIVAGAKLCLSKHHIAISKEDLNSMIKGVREPDDLSFSTLQMVKQRIEPGSYGKQRDIATIRIAAQSIHASPNPTRPIHDNSYGDQIALKKVLRNPQKSLLKKRLDVDIFSYDTNQGVRNKILLNASQFLCVSLAHKDKAQSARKFGNFMHMIGDSFSASHVQRSAPKGSPGKCGTSKIEWHYSMDLISWKQHRPADLNANDWRFRCVTEHAADLMQQWVSSRTYVQTVKGAKQKAAAATAEVKKSLKLLCSRILREDASILKLPAGGAAAGYSSASGTDHWEMFNEKKPDLAIQPVGLTSKEEARLFYKDVAEQLKADGEEAEFSYPSRDYPDFCINIMADEPLKAPLRCTPNEINWAMKDSPRVKTMWIPARKLQ